MALPATKMCRCSTANFSCQVLFRCKKSKELASFVCCSRARICEGENKWGNPYHVTPELGTDIWHLTCLTLQVWSVLVPGSRNCLRNEWSSRVWECVRVDQIDSCIMRSDWGQTCHYVTTVHLKSACCRSAQCFVSPAQTASCSDPLCHRQSQHIYMCMSLEMFVLWYFECVIF